MENHRKTYTALVAALRAEFDHGALSDLWAHMSEHRYNVGWLGVLAQAVHDAQDPAYVTQESCTRVGLHNCAAHGEWRNHDRANDMPEPGSRTFVCLIPGHSGCDPWNCRWATPTRPENPTRSGD